MGGMNTLLLINLVASWALVGLIWTIQLVHYPSFSFVAEDQFLEFHRHHTRSITWVVMPLMLVELALAFYLAADYQWGWQWLSLLIIVLLLWALTFFFAVPLHNQLGLGKNEIIIQKLVSANWPRTILWTIKALWLSVLVYYSWT
jgi:hypothetical protein